MGFNLGSFVVGGLKTLSEKVETQSAQADADTKKYLEAGITEGRAANRIYQAENKQYRQLGQQLDALGMGNNQIKLIMNGGIDSTKSFIKAANDAKSLDTDNRKVDLSKWVNVEGKPSSSTWEDYITKVIQGVPDRDSAVQVMTQPKQNSILGSWAGSTATPQRDTRMESQMQTMGEGMNIDVRSVLAAGTGDYIRDAEMRVSGNVSTKDLQQSGAYEAARATVAFVNSYRPLQIKQAQMAINKAVTDVDKAAALKVMQELRDEYEKRKIKADNINLTWKVENNVEAKVMEAQLVNAEQTILNKGVPSSYENGILLMGHRLMEELEKPEPDPALVALYQTKKDKYTLQYAELRSSQSNASTDQTFTTYVNMFENIMGEELAKQQGGDNSKYSRIETNTGGFKFVYTGSNNEAAWGNFQKARQFAVIRYIKATEGFIGPNAKLARTVIESYNDAAAPDISPAHKLTHKPDGTPMTYEEIVDSGITDYHKNGKNTKVRPDEFVVIRAIQNGKTVPMLILGSKLIKSKRAIEISVDADGVEIQNDGTNHTVGGVTYKIDGSVMP